MNSGRCCVSGGGRGCVNGAGLGCVSLVHAEVHGSVCLHGCVSRGRLCDCLLIRCTGLNMCLCVTLSIRCFQGSTRAAWDRSPSQVSMEAFKTGRAGSLSGVSSTWWLLLPEDTSPVRSQTKGLAIRFHPYLNPATKQTPVDGANLETRSRQDATFGRTKRLAGDYSGFQVKVQGTERKVGARLLERKLLLLRDELRPVGLSESFNVKLLLRTTCGCRYSWSFRCVVSACGQGLPCTAKEGVCEGTCSSGGHGEKVSS